MGDRLELLRRMAVFGALRRDSLQLILDHSDEVSVAEDNFFFREGEAGDSLFVLETGAVVIQRHWEDQEIELGRLRAGDCFGEMALVDFRPRSASVKAESSCRAIEVPSRAIRGLHQIEVEQYAILMMNLGREISRRLRIADDYLFRLRQTSPNSEAMPFATG